MKKTRQTDFCDGCCYRRTCAHDLTKCCYLVAKKCILDNYHYHDEELRI